MATTSKAFDGVVAVLMWTPSGGGSAVKISGASNEISIESEANEIDAPFRDNPEFALAGTIDRSLSMSYLDWEGGTPVDDIDERDTGTLDFYPEGNATGLRKWSWPAQVTGKPYTSSINEAANGTLGFKLTGAKTVSLVV